MVKDAEFSGADDKAEKAITEIKTDYKPWFSPLFEPKSVEIESSIMVLLIMGWYTVCKGGIPFTSCNMVYFEKVFTEGKSGVQETVALIKYYAGRLPRLG